MSVRQSLLFFSLAALAVSGTASAQDRDQTFRERDRNNDGVLTQGEYGGHPGNFQSLDTNGDGVLNYEEFVRRHGRVDSPTFADPFAVMDRNNDGLVGMKEWTGPIREFREWDVNDNGALTRSEFNNKGVVAEDLLVIRRRFGALDRDDDFRLSRSEARMDSPEFNRADSNRNGYISPAEYITWTRRYAAGTAFDAVDRNHDGVVTYVEWQSEHRGDRAAFNRVDRNNDGTLSRAEFDNLPVATNVPYGRLEDFRALDRNDDGVLTRNESRLSTSEYDRADVNNDGVLTLKEYSNTADNDQFGVLDRNNDGMVSRWEWNGNRDDFDRVDRNNDGTLSRAEFDNLPVAMNVPYGRLEDFRALDRNDDGVLTRNESRLSTSEFDRADVDNDGVLTLKEYSNTTDNDQFDVLDRNNDGMVSRWEWNGNRDDFDRMDGNGDGVLSRSEFDRRSSGGFLGSILGRVEDVRFNDLDLNNDGVLTSSEWRGSMSEFDRLDRNNDGVVSFREYWDRGQADDDYGWDDRLREFDGNRDGVLTRSEWRGDAETFALLDTSRNGRLESQEISNPSPLRERFRVLDGNRDGWISRQEWRGSQASFDFFDRDRDRRLSDREYVGNY